LGTCAATGLPQQAFASLARRSPAPASRARSTKKLHRKNHRSPLVTTMAPSAYLAPSAQVQIPLKVLYQHARAVVLGRPLAVSAVAAGQRDSACIASSC